MVKLRFRARGRAMVPHFGMGFHEAQTMAGPARFIGRRFDAAYADPSRGVAGGWVPLPDGEEIASESIHLPEWKRSVLEGALWCADQQTATALGVPFDPRFGGEYDLAEADDK